MKAFANMVAAILMLVLGVGYIIWPFDFMPGVAIDDAIAAVLSIYGIINRLFAAIKD